MCVLRIQAPTQKVSSIALLYFPRVLPQQRSYMNSSYSSLGCVRYREVWRATSFSLLYVHSLSSSGIDTARVILQYRTHVPLRFRTIVARAARRRRRRMSAEKGEMKGKFHFIWHSLRKLWPRLSDESCIYKNGSCELECSFQKSTALMRPLVGSYGLLG